MSRAAAPAVESEFLDREGVVKFLHAKGLKHITERSIIRATYENETLKSTRIGARVYWHREDIDAWLDALRNQTVEKERAQRVRAKVKADTARRKLAEIDSELDELDDNAIDDPANNWEE